MMDSVLKYSQPVILLAVFFILLLKSCNERENIEKEFRRDAILETKVDSLKSVIDDIDSRLFLFDMNIGESTNRIKTNKSHYEELKKDITGKPADSVYNWTRLRLRKRAE